MEQKLLYTEKGPNGSLYKKGEWKEFILHTEEVIKGFFGSYRFLSNFWSAQIILDEIKFSSVELAYQAAKWKKENREYFLTCSELESIDYNRNNKPDRYDEEEWNSKKVEIMKNLVRQKFDPQNNPENFKKLMETGNKHLEEMNWWDDLFWGTDKTGNGENMLGRILMETREGLDDIG